MFTSILGFWVWGFVWLIVLAGRWAFEMADGRSMNYGVLEVKREDEDFWADNGDGKSKGKDNGFVVEEKEASD